jgi:hypothetical protein
MVEGPGEPNLKRVRLQRAEQAVGIEMIKATLNRAPSRDPRLTMKY